MAGWLLGLAAGFGIPRGIGIPSGRRAVETGSTAAMVTETDAANAVKAVLGKYGPYLPSEVVNAMNGVAATSIIQILPAAQYRPQFDIYFRNFFAAINAKAFGTQRVIGIANADAEVCGSFNCPAFCSPAMSISGRKVYVNNDEPNTFATLCHELCHYISHPNFYPEFYAMGGDNPFILEGVTEYLTRNISPFVAQQRSAAKKYQANYDAVSNALIAGSQSEADMINFALKGKFTTLAGLNGVAPGQAPLAPPPARSAAATAGGSA
ncbi:MAG TPA: hypothetical protein VHC04_09070 [Rhodopila sp.]|nr:hypothetical protein [Rhodopila sp.]